MATQHTLSIEICSMCSVRGSGSAKPGGMAPLIRGLQGNCRPSAPTGHGWYGPPVGIARTLNTSPAPHETNCVGARA